MMLFKKASQKVFFDGDREENWELYKKRGASMSRMDPHADKIAQNIF